MMLFLVMLGRVAGADVKLEHVYNENVPRGLRAWVPGKPRPDEWRVFRLTGLREGQRYVVVFRKGDDALFVVGAAQPDGSFRRLNEGSGGAALLYGPEVDVSAAPLGSAAEPGVVLHGGGGLDFSVLVFSRGLKGPAHFQQFDVANSASSVGGLSVGAGRDRRGRFCVEEYTVGPPDSGPSQVVTRWVWTGRGFTQSQEK